MHKFSVANGEIPGGDAAQSAFGYATVAAGYTSALGFAYQKPEPGKRAFDLIMDKGNLFQYGSSLKPETCVICGRTADGSWRFEGTDGYVCSKAPNERGVGSCFDLCLWEHFRLLGEGVFGFATAPEAVRNELLAAKRLERYSAGWFHLVHKFRQGNDELADLWTKCRLSGELLDRPSKRVAETPKPVEYLSEPTIFRPQLHNCDCLVAVSPDETIGDAYDLVACDGAQYTFWYAHRKCPDCNGTGKLFRIDDEPEEARHDSGAIVGLCGFLLFAVMAIALVIRYVQLRY